MTYPHYRGVGGRFYPEWGEDFGWQREGDAIVLENTPHLKPIPLAREASVVPHARALDLLQHREFEALMDERLIGDILVTPTLWQGTVTLSQTQGTERFRLVIANTRNTSWTTQCLTIELPRKRTGGLPSSNTLSFDQEF
jgi:hypothetical protein